MAEINEMRAIMILRREDLERIAVRRRISLIRFIEGGPPRFAVTRMNHHRVMEGNRDRRPLVRNSLRV